MSTATIPFICRNGFLPFCAADAPAMGSNFDYVVLPVASGDEGLAAAMQLYWMLERVTFTPIGTVTYIPNSKTKSFTKTFSGPLPDTTGGLFNFTLRGSIAGATNFTSTSQPFVEPALRMCPDVNRICTLQMDYITGSGATLEQESASTVDFYLSYVGEWRLYYRFTFYLQATIPVLGYYILGRITNPADPTSLYDTVASGSFSLFGLTLQWTAKRPSPGSTFSFTGGGLSATSDFLTF